MHNQACKAPMSLNLHNYCGEIFRPVTTTRMNTFIKVIGHIQQQQIIPKNMQSVFCIHINILLIGVYLGKGHELSVFRASFRWIVRHRYRLWYSVFSFEITFYLEFCDPYQLLSENIIFHYTCIRSIQTVTITIWKADSRIRERRGGTGDKVYAPWVALNLTPIAYRTRMCKYKMNKRLLSWKIQAREASNEKNRRSISENL